MTVLLGGRAAEQVVLGHLSTGAADDLTKVSEIARAMVERYAMASELGPVVYAGEQAAFLGGPGVERRGHSEQTTHEIDLAVRRLVEDALAQATETLATVRLVLEDTAARLIREETLDEAALAPYLERARAGRAAST